MRSEIVGITSALLPNGCDFTDSQKRAITFNESANIVAGPGTGKTTVLIAKCAYLLKETINSSGGICLITHTNVAVDEIRLGLKKVGISDIEYPNFIGTIQDFFNTFFAKKAFHLICGDKNIRVLDDDEYEAIYFEVFEQCKPNWYTRRTPKLKNMKPRLVISNDGKLSIESFAKSNYKREFEHSIKSIFRRGILTNHQCLELSKWYIAKYKVQLQKAITNRFSHVFLDEAQDTNDLQYMLLNDLFMNSNVCYQKFGDPYQALYNIYDGNHDTWVPSNEVEQFPKINIFQTSRFGSSITDIVKNVCIERYDSFESSDVIFSFPPYYIVYEDEVDLLKKYRELISLCKSKSESFCGTEKKDAIVAPFHADLEGLFSSYVKPSTNSGNGEGRIRKSYNYLLKLISKEIDISFKELKEMVNKDLYYREKISVCIQELMKSNSRIDLVIDNLEEVLTILTNQTKLNFKYIDIENQILYLQKYLLNEELVPVVDNKLEFYIGTIHSVKGETHRSTLLVLDTLFKEYLPDRSVKERHILKLLRTYLIGNYVSPQSISDYSEKDETIKALKFAYVALSRPTHLAVIALPGRMISDSNEIMQELDRNGWTKYESGIECYR